jgi:GGDEF domain-containing protein
MEDFKKKYMDGKEIIQISSKEYYSDSEGYPNEKAFYHFVNTITADDKVYLYCVNIDLSKINENKGRKIGDKVLKTIFNQISSVTPIFRIQGTKFNIILKEKNKDMDKAFVKFFKDVCIYGKVVEEKYLTKGNVYELQRKGIELMYQDRIDKLPSATNNKSINDTNSVNTNATDESNFIIPFEEDFKNNEEYQKEAGIFKPDESLWYATITIHETNPKVRDLKAYVFPLEYKPNMELVNCIVSYDDFIMSRVYTGNNPVVPVDGMKLFFSAKFNSNNRLNVSILQDSESVINGTGEIDYDIEIHEGKYIPESFGKKANSNLIFPVKRNSKGLEEYVMLNTTNGEVTYRSDGIYDGKRTYEVHRDFKGIHLIEVKKAIKSA